MSDMTSHEGRSAGRRRTLTLAAGAVFAAILCLTTVPVLPQAAARRGPAASAATGANAADPAPSAVDERATIRRDRYGVPHILAESEEAAAFAHGYATAEDHGPELARLFLRAKGTLSLVFGAQYAKIDLNSRILGIQDVAVRRFPEMPPHMQGILQGYAAGYNAYLAQHRGEFPAWATPVTAVDVLAHARAVLLLDFALNLGQWLEGPRPEAASNVWAVGRPLSKSGHGLLLANPHLPWTDAMTFHEVQLTVPGVINVSGATLLGLPVVTIGFNEVLGWSHTVNTLDADDLYELTLDATEEHYQYDGRWLPLRSRTVTYQVRTDTGVETRHERVLESHYGPVRIRNGKAYAFKSANLEAVNFLTQWNAMAKATSLQAFSDALNMQQLPMFNVGYADRQGNTWYVFDGRIPIRPPGFDWAGAVPGNTSRTEWFAMRPLYELPQLRNPKSGYIQNCNDAPWFTNLEERIDPASYASYLKQPAELNWRTQISLRILSHERELTLERMIQHKFNAELPYAERVKADLLPLARARDEAPVRQAADVLASWDNRTDADSRGAVLFLAWQEEYSKVAPTLYATAWSAANPLQTPTGLANPSAAVDALARAAANVQEHYGALDVPWGDVHRLRRGSLDLPIGGTPWTLHNARYRRDLDRKLVIGGGDTYILLVEFGDEGPRAFSVIPYSESANPASPHYNDQGPLYAADRLKPAWFSEADITANTLRRYQPHAAPPSTSSSARQPAPRADRARARS